MKIHAALALLALAALALNGVGVPRRMPGIWAKVREAVREARTWNESGFRISSDYLNDVRRMVRRAVAPETELALVPETEGRLDSVERSTHLAAAFERLPGRVDLVGPFGMLAYDALLLPWGSGRVHGADLRAAGFEKTDETLAWELWARAQPAPEASVLRERIEEGDAHSDHIIDVARDELQPVDEGRRGDQGVDGGSLPTGSLGFAADLSPRERHFSVDGQDAVGKGREDVVPEPLPQGDGARIAAALCDSLFQFADGDEGQEQGFRILPPEPVDHLNVRTAIGEFADDAGVEEELHKETSLPKSDASRETSSVSPAPSFGQERSASTNERGLRSALLAGDADGSSPEASGTRITWKEYEPYSLGTATLMRFLRGRAMVSMGGMASTSCSGRILAHPEPDAQGNRIARPNALREASGLALVAAVALYGAWAAGWTGALFAVAGWALALGAALVAGWTGPAAAAATAVAVAAAAAVMHNAHSRMHTARSLRENEAPPPPRTPREESLRSLRSLREKMTAAAFAAAWTLLALFATLSHTFSPPNGLGVSGGRAALWLLSGGIPEGFFSDPALATFQPSYPPGLALLTLGAWSAAGGVGEWLTQLLALVPFCALLWLLLSRAPGFAAKFWVFALFCTGTALNMASLYYSEGWMLLFLCVGLSRLPRASRDGDGTGGIFLSWALIGFAGFFKNEGILFAGLLWAVVRCFRGRRTTPLPALLAGLAPALAWIAFSRWRGGALADYAPLWAPDGGRFLFALGRILRDAFLAPWATVFAWPLAALGLLASAATVLSRFARAAARAKPEGRPEGESARSESALCRETPRTPRTPRENQTLRSLRSLRENQTLRSLRSLRENQTLRSLRENPTPRPLREAAALLLFCVPAIAFVYSLSRAPDLDWHVWSSLPRLLWDAAVLAAAVVCRPPPRLAIRVGVR